VDVGIALSPTVGLLPTSLVLQCRAASFDYFRNRLIDANNRL